MKKVNMYFYIKAHLVKSSLAFKDIKQNPDLRIAVLKGTSYEMIAKVLFPQKTIWLLESYEEFAKKATPNDLLLWTESQAIAWNAKHPSFYIIFPATSIGVELLAYPVNENAGRFLTFLNLWLELKRSEGITDEQYKLWVQGKTNLATSDGGRWSILRNVLLKKQKE